MKIIPIILCGGSGRRLWPRSRKWKPKPFLPLVGTTTLFEETLRRCADSDHFDPPVIVTGKNYVEFTETDLAEDLGSQIIVEPEPKNTAAAVALAALRLPADAVMLVCPSDHHIDNNAEFVLKARKAADLAHQGWLACLGIEARSPETRFGYIKRGQPLGEDMYKIAAFTEKPTREVAERFIASDEYSWNAGIFAFRAGTYLEELENYRPALAASIRRSVEQGRWEASRFYPDAGVFSAADAESLDYAVLEHTNRAAVVLARIGWSDVGNWLALGDARQRDEQGNSVRGPAELVDCRNVMVDTDGPRVAVIGLSDLIVVVDGNDIMISSAGSAHQISEQAGEGADEQGASPRSRNQQG